MPTSTASREQVMSSMMAMRRTDAQLLLLFFFCFETLRNGYGIIRITTIIHTVHTEVTSDYWRYPPHSAHGFMGRMSRLYKLYKPLNNLFQQNSQCNSDRPAFQKVAKLILAFGCSHEILSTIFMDPARLFNRAFTHAIHHEEV